MPLDDKAQTILIISTHLGFFKYKRIPFIISSTPGIFQRFMESAIQYILGVSIFLDEIIISGKDVDKNLERVERTEKCKFIKENVKYLGYVIDKEGIHPCQENLKAMKSLPSSTNSKELKSLPGLLNCCSQFIPQQKYRQTMLATDAYGIGLGAVLLQRSDDGTERPICLASIVLNKSERNYSVSDKEGLSIIWDYRPLERIYGPHSGIPENISSRLIRWALKLSAYDYDIKYREAKHNTLADTLSRLPL
ncbi:hypothetical protein RF11_00216 [Thelohanellus kitauei]|uniref:Reverse transcriptase/retrotransposon-derived protein RNase H-like domain-containing protein n=1 Tax=Thelohanellus kitauei TaxID=669202 RepID=A0A0C2JL18_THEKT|nr:hypothetical protein RF11_00216 [Thelohanellus kitauei]